MASDQVPLGSAHAQNFWLHMHRNVQSNEDAAQALVEAERGERILLANVFMKSETEVTCPRNHGLLSCLREDLLNFDTLNVFLNSSLLKCCLETDS
jgi:hypothetical protein